MKISFFETEPWEKEFLVDTLANHALSFHEGPLNANSAAVAAEADAVSVFIYSRIDADTLRALPNVKFVTTRSMGYDHIDLAACAAAGVAVSRVPAYGERTVAEHTFALILALSRKIFLAYERTEAGQFDYHGLRGFDLFGKTIGIVGGGNIGLNAARIAKGFAMDVLVYDPFPRQELAAEIGFDYVPLDDLLRRAHVVTLHCPSTPETHHLINAERLALMKPEAVLVNTARGALVDTEALLAALNGGRLAGAGLDVLEEECLVREESELMGRHFPKKCDLNQLMRNHRLIERDDVIITPHIAFNSREAVARILGTTSENLEAFAAGKPVNLVIH